eukprot:s151_g9.t1
MKEPGGGASHLSGGFHGGNKSLKCFFSSPGGAFFLKGDGPDMKAHCANGPYAMAPDVPSAPYSACTALPSQVLIKPGRRKRDSFSCFSSPSLEL